MENIIPEPLRGIDKAGDFFQGYGRYLGKLLGNMDFEAMERVVGLVLEKTREGHTIFFVGNGGSAATSSHFATDLVQCSRPDKGIMFRAISLVDNVPLLTALANDYSYEDVFTVQMKSLFQKGDMLVAISGSGNSPNVLAAVRLAREMGGVTVALAGFDGGKMAPLCDHVILVKTEKGEYGPVEDIHMVIDHMFSCYLRMKLSRE
jgi:D-sedoheptulose 7-phosphate isomerase